MLRYFCSECGSNLFMRPGDNVSVDKGLKIISYGSLDREEGDGRWRESNSLIRVNHSAKSRSGLFSRAEGDFPRSTTSFRSNRERKSPT